MDGIFILEISTPIKYQVWPIFYQILMNYIRKKTKQGRRGGWGEDMEYPHVLKKEHVEVPGVNFSKCRISMGLGF